MQPSPCDPIFVKRRHLFMEDRPFEPICESYMDDNDLEVRFTIPYEAWREFEVNRAPRGR